jgi:hypothetical protein
MATAVKAVKRATQADPLEAAILAACGGDVDLLRSYQLARERGLLGTAVCLGEEGGPERAEIWETPSGSEPGRRYRLRVEHAYGRVRCACVASSYGNPACAHRGSVVYAMHRRAAEERAAARDFAAWGFWDGVQGVTYA